MRASHVVIPALASALLGACAAASGSASAPNAAAPGPSVPPPRPGILGCVESRELKAYVLALDAQRERSRRAALAALGATPEDRRGVFGAAGAAALDQSYEADGKRFAVAAELAPHFEPRAALAKLVGETRSPRRVSPNVEEGPSAGCPIGTGSTCPSPAQRGRGEPGTNLGHEVLGPELRRIDERPRAHAVDVLVCGLERCAVPGAGPRAAVRPLLVELAPGESWGGPLELAYDYWWAHVRYDRRATCSQREQR